MKMDVRNMIAIAGVLFGIIALGIAGGAYGKIQGLPQCCDGNLSGCKSVTVFGVLAVPCTSQNSCDDENAVEHDGCCYLIEGNSGFTAIIFCAISVGCIIFTGVLGECLENCPACCQNCSACILGFVNILGLAFVGVLLGFAFSSPDNDAAGCDATFAEATETSGMVWAYLIMLAIAQLLSCIVAVMSSSCCQEKEEEEN